MHPSTRLVVWFLVLVAIQGLDGYLLMAVLLISLFFSGRALRRFADNSFGVLAGCCCRCLSSLPGAVLAILFGPA